MKIVIDNSKCMGCNMCEDLSEGAIGIKFGSDGKAGVDPKVNLDDKEIAEAVELAAEACPMQAIKVEKN